MSEPDSLCSNRNSISAVLDRLAASVGCSVEAFSDQASHELAQTLELLKLWLAIESPQDRAKALSALRSATTKAWALDENRAQTPGEPVALAHTVHQPE